MGAPYLARFSRDVGFHGSFPPTLNSSDPADGRVGCPTFASAYVGRKNPGEARRRFNFLSDSPRGSLELRAGSWLPAPEPRPLPPCPRSPTGGPSFSPRARCASHT